MKKTIARYQKNQIENTRDIFFLRLYFFQEYLTRDITLNKESDKVTKSCDPTLNRTKVIKQQKPPIFMEENEQVFQRYQCEANFGKSIHLIKLDTIILKKFTQFVQKPMTEVTKDDVLNYFHSLTLAPYSIELHKSQIKKFFKWLYNFEATQKVPEQVAWIKVNRSKVYKYKTKADILTKAEVETIIGVCKNTVEKAMIAVLFDSAARIGEFVNLKVGDVICEGNEYSICVDGKTGQRTIPLNNSVKYLLEYLDGHPNKNSRASHLWFSSRNQKYSRCGMFSIVKAIARRSQIQKRISCHIFRHSRLTELAHEGMNESQMRVFAGWTNSSMMPAIYLHLSGDDVRQALRKIEPKVTFVESNTIEQQVTQRLEEEKQKMHDEILAQLIETLKDLQHRAIQDYLFNQTEQ